MSQKSVHQNYWKLQTKMQVISYFNSTNLEEWMHWFHHGIENASQRFPILITVGQFHHVFKYDDLEMKGSVI